MATVISVTETVAEVLTVDEVTTVTVAETTNLISEQVGGIQGVKGDTGATGATGATGSSGVIGVDSGELTNTGTSTAAQLGLATAGTAGTYTKVTTDSFGRVTSGTTLLLTDLPFGVALTGSANAFTVGGHTITAESATVKPLILKAASSQSVNLQEWQDSSGSILTRIGPEGRLRVGGANGIGTGITSSTAGIGAIDPAWTVLTVKGTASQTANLQEWQNSAGTVLATVNSTGGLIASNFNTSLFYATLTEENSGGRLRLTKMTSAAANPSAGQAKIYLRDGTNAGTLKLVVRAGTAGAETTILDNIPQ